MRVGRYTVETITLTCPECDEPAYAPNGSLYITEEEHSKLARVYQCQCGAEFLKPEWPKQRKAKQ